MLWSLMSAPPSHPRSRVILHLTVEFSSPLTSADGTATPHMHRALQGRHVSMIAIAGTIGTGLFL